MEVEKTAEEDDPRQNTPPAAPLGFKAQIPQHGGYLLEKAVTREPNWVPQVKALILLGFGVLYCPYP